MCFLCEHVNFTREVRSVDTSCLYLKLGFCLFSRKSHEGVVLLSGQCRDRDVLYGSVWTLGVAP